MGDVGGRVEEPVDAVAAVALHHGEAVGLGVLLDDVAQLPVANAGLHCRRWRERRGGRGQELRVERSFKG